MSDVHLQCRLEVIEDLLASAIAHFAVLSLGREAVTDWVGNLRRLACLRDVSTEHQEEYRRALEAFVAKVEQRLSG